MSSTTTEHPAQVTGGIVAAGLLALGQHMADHHLPAPFDVSIDAPDGVIVMRVAVYTWHADAWLNSVTDATVLSREEHPSGTAVTVRMVTLPETCTRVQVRTIDVPAPGPPSAITCPDCQGNGELYGDWRRDPDSGRYYAEAIGLCLRCNGEGETVLDVTACDGCPTTAEPFPVEDNQCTHGLALCEDHADICSECILESEDVDLYEPWDDPWADAS